MGQNFSSFLQSFVFLFILCFLYFLTSFIFFVFYSFLFCLWLLLFFLIFKIQPFNPSFPQTNIYDEIHDCPFSSVIFKYLLFIFISHKKDKTPNKFEALCNRMVTHGVEVRDQGRHKAKETVSFKGECLTV